ncbi:MAG: WG repeat-containing protein [Calditrichaeota bacterium]|nr:WG repeat-containing protein [Calditrichota bacterium]MCB9365602.1 WG repeat-containing protein [Calditrichota bacterium]
MNMKSQHFAFLLVACLFLAGCKTKEKPVATPPKTEVTKKQNLAHNLYPVFENGKWGFVDENGDMAVEPQYEWADAMTEGMARVKQNDKWGYVNLAGQLVVEPKYERARRYTEGHGAVRENGKYGYLDRSGNVVVEFQYSKLAQEFSEGLAAVPNAEKKFGFINERGETVIPHQFDNAHVFQEGLAAAEINEKWGFIDKTGKWVIEPQYVWTDKFVNGHSLIRVGTQPDVDYGLITRDGKLLFTLKTLHAKTPSDGLVLVQKDQKWGFVDYSGVFVLPATYDAAFSFSEGLAAVRIGNGWGYVDRSGKLALNLEYNLAEEFHDGIARVTWPGGTWGYVDLTGGTIWRSKLPGSPQQSEDAEG